MKKSAKYFVISLIVLGFAGFSGILFAADATNGVTVTMGNVDKLRIQGGNATILLDNDDVTEGVSLTAWDQSAEAIDIDITHNSATDKKITAIVNAGDGPADGATSISLEVDVAASGSWKTLYSAGTREATAKDVLSNISRGGSQNNAVVYRAQADMDTDAAAYVFTVTYTSVGM